MAGPVIIKTTFLLRRGSEEEWVTKNPILKYGEPGIAVDTMNFKIGDGETPWNDLDSISGGLAEPIDCVDAGTTPYGVVWNTGEGAVTGTLNTEDAESAFYFVPSSTTGTQAQGQYERSLTGGAIVYFPYGENWFKFTATEFDIREKAVRYLISASGDQYTYEQIASLHNLEIRSVNELPTASIDTLNAIYLVPSASGETKEEYVTVVDTVQGETVYSWDQIGDTEIDLSGYAHKIVGGTTGNLVAFDNTGDLVDSGSKVSDFQSKIQYVTLEHGSGTLTQAQHDILFAQNGYACIVYQDVNGQSILERSGVSGSVFYWTATEINGNQLLTKQIGVNFTTDAWEYSVKELEEKIDLIEIDTSTLPATLNQTTYNTLFSSKLNKIVDIAQDNHHTRNRVYSYVDDIFDDVAEKTYTRFGCTYNDGTIIKRSIITVDRSNRSCSAPVDYFFTAGDNINISNNVISYSGIEFIDKTTSQIENTPLTQDEIAKLISGKAAIRISYGSDSGVYYLVGNSDYDNKLVLVKISPAPHVYASANRLRLSALIYNKTTGALVKQSLYASRDIVVAGNIETNSITKFSSDSSSQKGAEIVAATAGTDYIAPGDSRLIPSGGTTGQFLAKSSNSNYATEWITIPRLYSVSTATELEDLVEDLPDDLFAIEISENQEEDNCLLWQDAIGLAIDEEFDGPYITKEQEHIAGIFYVEATSENSADLRTAYGSLSFSIATDAETGIPRIYWGDWISDAFATNTSVDEKLNNILRIYDIYEIVEILEAGDPLPDNLLAIEISERDVDAFRNIYEYSYELRSCIYVTSPGYGSSIEVPSPFRVFVNTPSEPEELPSGTIKTAVGERSFHGETDAETGDSTIIYGDWISNVFITQEEKITNVANINSNVNVPTGAVVKSYVDTAVSASALVVQPEYDAEHDDWKILDEDEAEEIVSILSNETQKTLILEFLGDHEELEPSRRETVNRWEPYSENSWDITTEHNTYGLLFETDAETGVSRITLFNQISDLPKVFEVCLNKNDWEENEQVVEHKYFFAEGFVYSVEPKTNMDNVIATEAEIEAIEVTYGEMTFAYGGTAPSANVTFIVRAERAEIEGPVEPSITAKSIITTLSYDSEDNQVLTPPVDVEEVYAAVLNGELYYIVLTYPDGMVSQSVINEVVTNNSGTYAIKFNFGTIGLEDGNQFIDIDVR